MSVQNRNKSALSGLRAAFVSTDAGRVRTSLQGHFAEDAVIRLGYPFGELVGPKALWDQVYGSLFASFPNLERRDFIFMAGSGWGDARDGEWIGLGGNFVGTFQNDWLGIPATKMPVFMRYHEYLRMEDGKVVEMEGLWDIPQIMVQANAWPMPPQRGVEWMCPGPADGKGVIEDDYDKPRADASVQIVWDMLHDLKQGDANHSERGLEGYWHPECLWYGSTGIGTAHGHEGLVKTVLNQFRKGLSDNTRYLEKGVFFGDQDLVAFSGWPSGEATHTGDNFLGLSATGKRFTRRSLDFWRIENGLIRENWVMVDMLDLYRQLGFDILGSMDQRSKR